MYLNGEWLDEQGRLNEDFVHWMAEEWTKFPALQKRNIQIVMLDVRKYFTQEPEELPIQWKLFLANSQAE